ncbi:NUDIX hydrolase [Marinactinospora thermotolerans]|uniref:NUDIX hydrolase n=1 Tax=Marinactinospora thermotolerans TaxID=531310 RepID=UPI003D8CEA83
MPSRTRCCGTSVGVLLTNPAGDILLIGRAWHPIGHAPVAGHVADEHASATEAAGAEVREEVGLTLIHMEVAWSGHLPNLCSSPPARRPGHTWTLVRGTAVGELRPAAGETTGAAWYTRHQVQALAQRTIAHAHSELPASDQPHDSLEAVWVEHLHRLGVLQITHHDLEAVRVLYSTPPRSYWVGDREIPAHTLDTTRI